MVNITQKSEWEALPTEVAKVSKQVILLILLPLPFPSLILVSQSEGHLLYFQRTEFSIAVSESEALTLPTFISQRENNLKSETTCTRVSKICVCACMFSRVWLCATAWSPPGFSVHGILQARILEGVAIPSSRGSSWPKNITQVSGVSCIGRQVLYHWEATSNI